MATTTNYGWTTPDDTALVKDGAAAIRTLGSSVDTTTKALNPSTTLGDIEYRSSSANTNTRLGIGSTGDVLTVAGGVPSWAAPAGAAALVFINSATGTGASEIAVDSVFSATYENYIVIFTGVASAACELRANFRTSATNNTDSNYESVSIFNNTSTTVAADASESQTKFRRFGFLNADNTATQWFIGSPFASKKTSYTSANIDMDTPRYRLAGGGFIASTSFDGISIADNDATATLTGTLRVYGVANS